MARPLKVTCGCNYAQYCSESCKEADWAEHRDECFYIARRKKNPSSDTSRFVLRSDNIFALKVRNKTTVHMGKLLQVHLEDEEWRRPHGRHSPGQGWRLPKEVQRPPRSLRRHRREGGERLSRGTSLNLGKFPSPVHNL